MIAFAITCLLVIAALAALLTMTDSAMRGWHAYRALGSELRVLRKRMDNAGPAPALREARLSGVRSPRRPALQQNMRPATLRAAA